MPQLNPAPWFAILMFTWILFLAILPPKVIKHSFHNEASPQSNKMPETTRWTWPWH